MMNSKTLKRSQPKNFPVFFVEVHLHHCIVSIARGQHGSKSRVFRLEDYRSREIGRAPRGAWRNKTFMNQKLAKERC